MAIVGRFFGARPRPARLDQVILICIPAVITSVVLYGLYYHLQGAWQLLGVAGGGFLSLTGFGLSLLLLLSLLVVLGVVPLFVEGLTPYIVDQLAS